MNLDAVGFGALNMDKLYYVNKIAKEDEESYIKNYAQTCGGSAANTIVGLSRLGLKTGYIGKISNDLDGNSLLENLKIEGVNTDGIISDEGRTGNVMGFVDVKGERALYVDPGVNDLIKLEEIKQDYLKNIKILHLTSFVGESIKAQEMLLERLPSSVMVSFDPGRLYAEKGLYNLEKILLRTDVLLLNKEELKLLTGNERDFEKLMRYNINIIVVKNGEKGCYFTTADDKIIHSVDALQVKCLDTTGAGDAFNAGFIYGLLNDETIYDSCLIGNIVAASCVENIGAMNGLPNLLEVESKFIELKNSRKS